MKRIIHTIVILLSAASFFSLNAQNKKTISAVGKWKYEVTQAPYGYDKGLFEIKETKDSLTGEITFTSGQKAKLQKMTMRNDTLWANVYAGGENVKLETKVDKSTIIGSVDTSMGVMSLKADKIVEQKK